ncbi:hypothetical protein [Stenotrophomonas maltophilia]|uniref:hypothetical protein n=1 Tax=Stenotrophomonas maltophilia TaxID=40324 RepID=UPI001F53814D|nr:hypothetical protein [Stenotrophomonas maltophilia]MCI1152000.1 hypothetical protein [Stenotrophomonas maltophilia]
MSFDDDFARSALRTLYATFGVDALVTRGSEAGIPVRIIVNRGEVRLGEYGQAVGLVDSVSFLHEQWKPKHGDVVAWSDRLGDHSKRVERPRRDDGLEVEVTLNG